jgi:hypothetical protein
MNDLRKALEESASLLAFLHGAFDDQLKPRDRERLNNAHRANRAALGGGGAELGANVWTCGTKSSANSPNVCISDGSGGQP